MTKREDWGRGSSGTPIGAAEFSKVRTHVKGAVALAHAGDAGALATHRRRRLGGRRLSGFRLGLRGDGRNSRRRHRRGRR